MSLEKPNPPVIGKVTHHTINLDWSHVKEYIPEKTHYKYKIEEQCAIRRNEWSSVYIGFGFSITVNNLEPATEYNFRLCLISTNNNERSNFSHPVSVKTTKEPNTGESLHRAILSDNHTEVFKILNTNQGKRLLEIPDRNGNLPLMIAVKRDYNYLSDSDIKMFKLLIEQGADFNAQNANLRTALMLAAFYGKTHLVKFLKSNGADYKIKDNSGMSAIHYAVDGGNIETVKYLLQTGANVNDVDSVRNWTPIIRAASMNCEVDLAEVLITFNADVNALDSNGQSALMIATLHGNLPFVKLLILSGADIHKKNQFGKTFYELAKAMDRKHVVNFFDIFVTENKIKNFKR